MQSREKSGQRSASTLVTVVGWIFALLALGATLISALQNLMFHFVFPNDRGFGDPLAQPGVPPEMAAIWSAMPWLLAFFLAASVATLVASIGLIRRIEWCRKLFLSLLAIMVLWQLGSIGYAFWFVRFTRAQMAEVPAEFARAFEASQWMVLSVTVVIALAFLGVFAWLFRRLTRADVRAEFGR